MTIKEIIEVLIIERNCVERQDTPLCDRNCANCDLVMPTGRVVKAYEQAIDILHQEPCTDAVSREEVKKIVDFYTEQYDGIFHVNESIDKLPSVNPQPCNDAISREAVLKIIDAWYENNRDTENIEDLIILITYMASVTQKSGKWIIRDDLATVRYYQCSECNEIDLDYSDYCPNCGAKMIEPQESEVSK